MKVLVVTHYFPPEVGAPQARLSEFARVWADLGHEVLVLTGMPNHPTGVIPEAYRHERIVRERVDGYRILRTWLYATPNEGFVRRVLGHLSFMVSAVLIGMPKTGRQDVVIVSSPTFFSIFAGWVIARTRRARLIVEVRDLWPALLVELEVLTNRTIIGILELLELAAYRAADRVVVVTEGFRQSLIERGIPEEKLDVIRNGVDLERFRIDLPADRELRAKMGARNEDEVVVLYVGAHGLSQGLLSIAEAATKLRDQDGIRFAFVGDGAAKSDLEEYVSRTGLRNVVLLPAVPREEVGAILRCADICVAPLRDIPLFTTFIPSKIFEYLGAGRPVIGSLRGEPARILDEAGAVVVEPEEPAQLASAIQALADDVERRKQMGREGRVYVEEHFERRKLAEQYEAILQDVVRASR